MKKAISLSLFGFLFSIGALAQTETYEFQGYSIGQSLMPPANYDRAMMPEIIYTGTEYIMYFGYESPPAFNIMYATSPDMNTWSIGDTILVGPGDPQNREYIMGGARVIKLPSGQYRMFYRASKEYTAPNPDYHIRSAISNDGKNFTKEGIVIENQANDPNSYFKHIGHSEFYFDAGGNLRALLTAKDTTMGNGPDNIYTATSADGGLTWSNFNMKYAECHDPVVIRDSSNQFHAYFTYLNTGFRTVKSPDGIGWPITPDTLVMIQAGNIITESSSPIKIADLGAGVDANGNIIIFSNHATAIGPWTHIAWWSDPEAGLDESTDHLNNIKVYPNPSSGTLHLSNLPNGLVNYSVILTDIYGKEVRKFNSESSISADQIHAGVYILQIRNEYESVIYSERVIIK